MTSYLVDARQYPTTNHLARRVLRYILNLLEEARIGLLNDELVELERIKEGKIKLVLQGKLKVKVFGRPYDVSEMNMMDLEENMLNIRLILFWIQQLRKRLPNAKRNPNIEFPLTIADAVVKIAKFRDSYAIVDEQEEYSGDLDMLGFSDIFHFRKVNNFRLPPPVRRIRLKIDIDKFRL